MTHVSSTLPWSTVIEQWRLTAEFLYFVAGILLLAGVVLAYRSYRSTVTASKQRNTLEKIASFRQLETEQRLVAGIRLIRTGALIGDQTFHSLPIEDQRTLVNLLNEWDELALYISYRILDEDLLYSRYASLGIEIWTHLRPSVLHHRKTSPKAWQAFDWLAVRWMIRMHRKDGSRRLKLLHEAQESLDKALKL